MKIIKSKIDGLIVILIKVDKGTGYGFPLNMQELYGYGFANGWNLKVFETIMEIDNENN